MIVTITVVATNVVSAWGERNERSERGDNRNETVTNKRRRKPVRDEKPEEQKKQLHSNLSTTQA